MKAQKILLACILIVVASKNVTAKENRRTADRLFVGEWTNVDPKTAGTTRFKITEDKGKWKVHGWGKCHPEDCDWREVPLNLFGASVSPAHPEYGFASWNFGFLDLHLIVHLEADLLVVESYNIFKDDSRRPNYRTVERFRKASIRSPVADNRNCLQLE